MFFFFLIKGFSVIETHALTQICSNSANVQSHVNKKSKTIWSRKTEPNSKKFRALVFFCGKNPSLKVPPFALLFRRWCYSPSKLGGVVVCIEPPSIAMNAQFLCALTYQKLLEKCSFRNQFKGSIRLGADWYPKFLHILNWMNVSPC